MQGRKNAHCSWFVQAADIGLRRFRPGEASHLGSLYRSISSWVIPSSASTCSGGIPLLCFSHSRPSSSAFASSAVTGSSSNGRLAIERATGSSVASVA